MTTLQTPLTATVSDIDIDQPTTGPSALWTWVVVGAVAACGMALLGTRVAAPPDPTSSAQWWFSLPSSFNSSHQGFLTLSFYGFAGLLVVAWLMVGQQARLGQLTMSRAWATLGAWGVPLALGPPLFSRDLYSYVGQGLIARNGMNPYAVGPSVLGAGHLLSSIPGVWRSTPAPYGPLFIAAARFVSPIFGSSLNGEVMAARALELLGVVLIMVFLPRLAKSVGVDAGIAVWLGALSPLALFGFVASGHNDALMIGLLVAGLAMARTGKMTLGLVLCALAMTVKVPAVLAIGFLGIEQFRLTSGRARTKILAQIVLIPLATIAAVTWVSGFGWSWLASGTLKVPTELRVLSTPSVAIGTFAYHALRIVGFPVAKHGTITVAQDLIALGAVVVVVWLALQVRPSNLVRLLGISFLIIVIASPTVWPWYLLWGLVILAATTAQNSKLVIATCALGMFMVMPSGSPIIRGNGYLIVVALCALGGLAFLFRKQWSSVTSNPSDEAAALLSLDANRDAEPVA